MVYGIHGIHGVHEDTERMQLWSHLGNKSGSILGYTVGATKYGDLGQVWWNKARQSTADGQIILVLIRWCAKRKSSRMPDRTCVGIMVGRVASGARPQGEGESREGKELEVNEKKWVEGRVVHEENQKFL